MGDVLGSILGRIEAGAAGGARPVVVFDLDSTLIDTAHRHLRILREFSLAEGAPALSALIDRLVPSDMGFRVEAALVAAGYDDEDVIVRLRQFWVRRFFTDAYCGADLPTPGAPAFARDCHAAGAVVVYLSARHVRAMAKGTIETLMRWDFPLFGGRALVHLNGDPKSSDAGFKQAALAELRALGTVVATFENEPGHANRYAEAFPGAIHVLLRTVCSPDAPEPLPTLWQIPDFVRRAADAGADDLG